jgi:predicted transcriptional regulator
MTDKLYIKDIMSKPVTIAKSAAITEALDKMLDDEVDPLIVTNDGTVIGTISRKSIAETLGSSKLSLKKPLGVAPAKIHVAKKTDEDFTSAYPDESADILVPLLQEYKIVVILDKEHRLIGQVNAIDLLKVLRPMTSIENVMQTAFTIRSDERVVHLRRRMLDENNYKFVVIDDGDILGIVTETDVAKSMKAFRKVVDDKYQDHRIRNLIVKDIMSSPTITLNKNESIEKVLNLIVDKNISSVPIVDNGRLAGLVTKQSLISAL